MVALACLYWCALLALLHASECFQQRERVGSFSVQIVPCKPRCKRPLVHVLGIAPIVLHVIRIF